MNKEDEQKYLSMTPPSGVSRPPGKKGSVSWCSERMRSLFTETLTEELTAQAAELNKSRRVLDFLIQPGRVTAKVYDEQSQPNAVQIFFKQLSDNEWDQVFEQLAGRAYFLALMLSGQIPSEMEEVFAAAGAELFPQTPEQIFITLNNEQDPVITGHIAAVLYRLFDRLDSDPFSIFILRGRGREETIVELRKRRTLLKKRPDFETSLSYQQIKYEPAPPLVSTIDYFWSSGSSLAELSYNIRADELPASILKWLDPLPLGGLENHVDFLLERAYEKVTRLAQGFGLRL